MAECPIELRKYKASCKRKFTNIRKDLLLYVQDKTADFTSDGVKERLDALVVIAEECLQVMMDVVDHLEGHPDKQDKVMDEIETLETEYSKAVDSASVAISICGSNRPSQASTRSASPDTLARKANITKVRGLLADSKQVSANAGSSGSVEKHNEVEEPTKMAAMAAGSSYHGNGDSTVSAVKPRVCDISVDVTGHPTGEALAFQTPVTMATGSVTGAPDYTTMDQNSYPEAGITARSTNPFRPNVVQAVQTEQSVMQQWQQPQLVQQSPVPQATPYNSSVNITQPMAIAHTYSPGAQPAPAAHALTAVSPATAPQPSPAGGVEPWRRMPRVGIPTFSGRQADYETWKAAFMACVDTSPAGPEYKLLQLRNYLAGEALDSIQSLGYSAAAYDAAKARLERKYGGQRRLIARHTEALESLPPVRQGRQKDIVQFVELLEIAIVNIKDTGRLSELQPGTFYNVLVKKLDEKLITQYQRWVHENSKSEKVETLYNWASLEAEFLTIAAETASHHSTAPPRAAGKPASKHSSSASYAVESEFKRKCVMCDKDHGIWDCDAFKRQSPADRWQTATSHRLCYRCLFGGHRGNDCKRFRACGVDGCKATHHSLLHREVQPTADKPQTVPDKVAPPIRPRTQSHYVEPSKESDADADTISQTNALRTVPVIVRAGNRGLRVNAMLDDGSTQSFISSSVAAELNVSGPSFTMAVGVLSGNQTEFQTTEVTVEVSSVDDTFTMPLTACTLDEVTGGTKAIDWASAKLQHDHLRDIPFPTVSEKVIDMLIGTDHPECHRSLNEVVGLPGQPVARKTVLGWTCIGPTQAPSRACNAFHISAETGSLNDILRQFWEVDSSGTQDPAPVTPEEKSALDFAEASLKWIGDRYEISIPWNEKQTELQNNISMATKRLDHTKKRLAKDTTVRESYYDTIKKYQEKGYIKEVTPQTTDEDVWYLPHFPIVRLDKSTTKVRIVFDAAAKFNDLSLNDAIFAGPKLQRELFDVLCRFRNYPVALVCDIQEMYLQISVAEKDRKRLRFLWCDGDVLRHYEFQRVVFGMNASPFLAQLVAQKHAERHREDLPMAAESVDKSTYMDDTLDSTKTDDLGIALYHQLVTLWGGAGMKARKWLSNSPKVMEKIPQEDRAAEINISETPLPTIKTLGVTWLAEADIFSFRHEEIPETTITKRFFLQKLATVFDPLGLVAPFIIRGKVLMQEMWASGADWDEPLSRDLELAARSWLNEIPQLGNIRVPRCIRLPDSQPPQLHVFVDASTDAYGAAVYVHSSTEEKAAVRLLASKSRVAPLKSLSIPRLELMAAVLGVELAESVANSTGIPLADAVFWTDSMDVLHWVRNISRKFKPFVAHRVGTIQTATEPQQWRHVPTKENPADIVSRGAQVASLTECTMWWEGPTFLMEPATEWPIVELPLKPSKTLEQRTSHAVTASKVPDRLSPARYSSWSRLVRVTAWVHRFVCNVSCEEPQRQRGELTATELHEAELTILGNAQKDAFPEAVKGNAIPSNSPLAKLSPKLDDDGLVRCDGRTQYAEWLPYDTRFPIILPRHHAVTQLIVKHHHEKQRHSGTNATLSSLATTYWIVSAREAIREWENVCAQCRRQRARPAEQIMAPLPKGRLQQPLRAFARTAVDFAGPFVTIQGRGRSRQKRYMCLFTCLLTRAVHIEMAAGLDTDSFLRAFARFVHRRGTPLQMFSDNGTNFVGANRELNDLVKQLDADAIRRSAANQAITWSFQPPASPHFGGAHEIMVKAAKKALSKVLGDADVTDEELNSAFIGVEALMNSRPLTYQSANPADVTPLTPNHFLIGQAGGQYLPDNAAEDVHPRNRWRRVQELLQHYWRRWILEWVPYLNPRSKWQRAIRDMQVDDIVLVMQADMPRGKWPMGRVTRIYPGKDGHVRVAEVKMSGKTLVRPIAKLCLLEF